MVTGIESHILKVLELIWLTFGAEIRISRIPMHGEHVKASYLHYTCVTPTIKTLIEGKNNITLCRLCFSWIPRA